MFRTSHGIDQQAADEPSHSGRRPSVDQRPASRDEKPLDKSDVGKGEEKTETGENKSRAPPEIPEVEDIYDVNARREKVYTQEEKANAWSEAAGMVKTYSDDMIKRWKEEIDTYLVFAGLFSAVLTTFNVQTYVLLSPASPDPSVAILLQISSQLASFSIHPPFVNSTQRPTLGILANPNQSSPIPRWAVWLNGLWFSGLILSLAAATIGIMAKQWMNEYLSGVAGKSRAAARLRQHRLNNLKKWHVEDIVGMIPVLLQLALALFLAGLLLLLWSLHNTLAAISSVLVGLLGGFVISTTLLPMFNTSCSYLTPQARAIYLCEPKYWVHCFHSGRHKVVTSIVQVFSSRPRILPHLIRALREFRTLMFSWLQLVGQTLAHVASPPNTWKDPKQTWQGREREAIGSLTTKLDTQILVEAYSTTLHPDALSAATVCLMDFNFNGVLGYFRQLHECAQEHFGPVADSENGPLGWGNQQQLLWLQIALCALILGNHSDLSETEKAALKIYFGCGSWSSSMKAADTEWAVSAMNSITDELASEDLSPTFMSQKRIAQERRYLLTGASTSDDNKVKALVQDVRWHYRQVRLTEKPATAHNVKEALTTHLKCIDVYLECAATALQARRPDGDLEIVRVYTRDVLAQLTRTLLEHFTGKQVQHIQTTVNASALRHTMRRLAGKVSVTVLQCIDGELLLDVLRMADTLAKPYDYDDDCFGEDIPAFARTLLKRIMCLFGGPGASSRVAISVFQAATRAYHDIHLTKEPTVAAAHTAGLKMHFECVNRFLAFADAALNVPLPSDDLQALRAYTRGAITQLTHTLLERFTSERMQHIRTEADAKALWRTMQALARSISDKVLRCIDDELVSDVLLLADTLAKPHKYGDGDYERGIQHLAHQLKERVISLKGDPREGYTLKEPPSSVHNAVAAVSPRGLLPLPESSLQFPSDSVTPLAN